MAVKEERAMQVIGGERQGLVLVPTVRQSIARRLLDFEESPVKLAKEHGIGLVAVVRIALSHERAESRRLQRRAFMLGKLSNSPNLPPALARRAA